MARRDRRNVRLPRGEPPRRRGETAAEEGRGGGGGGPLGRLLQRSKRWLALLVGVACAAGIAVGAALVLRSARPEREAVAAAMTEPLRAPTQPAPAEPPKPSREADKRAEPKLVEPVA